MGKIDLNRVKQDCLKNVKADTCHDLRDRKNVKSGITTTLDAATIPGTIPGTMIQQTELGHCSYITQSKLQQIPCLSS